MSNKIPVGEMSLDQLFHAKTITEKILTEYVGANVEVDREIVEKARIRLAIVENAITERKNSISSPPIEYDEISELRAGDTVEPTDEGSFDQSDITGGFKVETMDTTEKSADSHWKIGGPSK